MTITPFGVAVEPDDRLMEIGQGEWSILETGERKATALRYDLLGSVVIVAHNFSPDPCSLELQVVGCERGCLVDVLGDGGKLEVEDGRCQLRLGAYGYRWFRLQRRGGGGGAPATVGERPV